MRPSSRLVLLTAATAAFASVGMVVTTPAGAATSTVFGAGTPGFAVSASDVDIPVAPLLTVPPDFAGEPSLGMNWNTGAGLVMEGTAVQKVVLHPATGTVTWSDASPFSGITQNADPILATDPVSGTTIAGGDDTACSAMYRSTDDGAAWLPTIPCPLVADHPMVAVAPSATVPGTKVWYFCQQQALDNCATSTDDGVTWLPGVNLSFDCTYQHGHLRGGPDGVAYLPSSNCFDAADNNLVGGLRTEDDGVTWTGYTIPDAATPSSGFDPAVAVTPDNTLYEAWDSKVGHKPLISVSHDHGASWSAPVNVSSDLATPLVATTFATLASGDDGRLAYSYLGTPVGDPTKDPFADGFVGVWYLYTSFSYDGGVSWTTVQDTPTPVQVGEVDAGGTTTAGQRNLLDFMDSAVTKDGRVVVAFADGCLADCEAKAAQGDLAGATSLSTHAWATVAYQRTGRGLFMASDVTVPAAPTLTVTRTSTASNLSWNQPANGGTPITGYTVLRTIGSGAETAIATTTATSYSDTSAPTGLPLTYRVTATNGAGTGSPSNAVTVVTASAPAAPVATAAGALNQVQLSWTRPSDNGAAITGYVVRRSTVSGAETVLARTGAVTSFADTSIRPGTTYFYDVAAVNSAGTSPASAEVSATPYTTAAAPLLAATAGKGQVKLTWSVPADGGKAITGYQIYRGTTAGAESLVQTISSGTTYVDPGLTGGTTYFYRVAAVTSAGVGALSNEVSATPKKG